jgi:hypothetical protein
MNEIEGFVWHMSAKHPELRRQVRWHDVRTMAAREGVGIRVRPMSRPGRLLGADGKWEIQIDERLSEGARAFAGMHELVHFWRDRAEGSVFYSSMEWEPEPTEDFANFVAWYCTSAAHPYHAREFYTQDE